MSRVAQRFYKLRPSSSDLEHFGFLMLKNSEIRVGRELNHENICKEIRDDFLPTEAKTAIVARSFTDDDITVRSAGVIYNQSKQNLEILKQVYQMSAQASNEDAGGASAGDDRNEQRLKRAFKKRFREICGQLSDNKIQAIVQIGKVGTELFIFSRLTLQFNSSITQTKKIVGNA